LSLDVAAGELVAVVGPSGCGKTTTLKMINRLVEPTAGSIEVLGRDQRSVPVHVLRRQIGYVIQQIGLFPHQTIRRNITAVPELLGWDRLRIANRCEELVELIGLEPEVLDRYPAELSGGQQQRVGVARALAGDPSILLMDEPYSALDPIVRERLQSELIGLHARLDTTIVIVTHDIDEALRLADRIAIMDTAGSLAQYATPGEVLAEPASAFVAEFLGRERGLRRLALRRVGEVEIATGPIVAAGTDSRVALAVSADHSSSWVGVIDGDRRLLGWLPTDSLAGMQSVPATGLSAFHATVTTATALREALDVIVSAHSRSAAVVDDEGRYLGMISVDQVAGGLER